MLLLGIQWLNPVNRKIAVLSGQPPGRQTDDRQKEPIA